MERESLPMYDLRGPITRVIEVLSIAVAASLLALHVLRFAADPASFSWRVLVAVVAGAILADFISGVVHWSADTWGSESLPVLGRRFLHPFRIHHVNPRDFLRRDFIDCNGDVAMITVPVLLGALLLPTSGELGQLATGFVVGFTATILPTNQVHQWAHRPEPPRLVAWLQRGGVILSRTEHERHHASPYVVNYCIATGWCNRTLEAVGFFPALERVIRRVTGAEPRRDERESADDSAE